MRIEVLVDVKTTLGEGPLWDVGRAAALLDRLLRRPCLPLHRMTAARCAPGTCRRRSARWPCARTATAPSARSHNGFHTLDFKTGDVELIHDPEPDKPDNRLNDGKVDKRGRFVAGSMDTMEEGPNGALYRLDPDLSVHKLDDGIIVSNGPCWSPDGKHLLFRRYLVRGDLGLRLRPGHRQRRQPAHLHQGRHVEGGAADGATVDAKAACGAPPSMSASSSATRRTARVDRVIDMPVKKVTSVMFGGPDLDVLYVTSMAKPPLPRFPGDGVLRGSLFAIYDLGITGLPEPRFGG